MKGTEMLPCTQELNEAKRASQPEPTHAPNGSLGFVLQALVHVLLPTSQPSLLLHPLLGGTLPSPAHPTQGPHLSQRAFKEKAEYVRKLIRRQDFHEKANDSNMMAAQKQ